VRLIFTTHFLERSDERLYPVWLKDNVDGTKEDFQKWLHDYCKSNFEHLFEFADVLGQTDGFIIRKGDFLFVLCCTNKRIFMKTVKQRNSTEKYKKAKRVRKEFNRVDNIGEGENDYDI